MHLFFSMLQKKHCVCNNNGYQK